MLTCSPAGTTRIVSDDATPLIDEPVRIRVTGAGARSRVTLRAVCSDPASGLAYESWGDFIAVDGVVDAANQRPLAGTYRRPDPFGLWWSMASSPDCAYSRNLEPVGTTVYAEIDGERVAELGLLRARIARGVKVRRVRSAGLVATYFHPPAAGPVPGVMVLGGSEGGLASTEEVAALLASHGFASIALAYFGAPGLPQHLVRVPLEYVENAAEWLLAQPGIVGPGIGVVGWSRGGELALLLASVCPRITAVVGYAASGVVWPGYTGGLDFVAAWTRSGRDVPFASPGSGIARSNVFGPVVSRPWFASGLRSRGAEAAAIPLKHVSAPVILVSGGDDRVWPSRALTEMAIRRLPAPGGDGNGCVHLHYPAAGHRVGRVPGLPEPPTLRTGSAGVQFSLGGSRRGNAAAAADSWPRVLSFLADHLTRPAVSPAGGLGFA